MAEVYDRDLELLTEDAIGSLRGRLRERGPVLARHFDVWAASLARGEPVLRYFTHLDAFPLLLLPWWLEEAARGSVDVRFHRDVVYSSVAGYYFVRVVDNLMDQRPPEPQVLPALLVLHAEFQYALHRYFAPDHPFWEDFWAASYEAAETAATDTLSAGIDRDVFLRVSSRKVAGAKIPLAAVCHHYDRQDLLTPWANFVDVLGRWHQMRNDVFDWRRDIERGTATYFLGEAERQAGADGSIAAWVLSDGLAWAISELDTWMDELLDLAAGLGSPPLLEYLRDRRGRLDEQWIVVRDSLAALDQLSATLSASQRSASATDQPLRRA